MIRKYFAILVILPVITVHCRFPGPAQKIYNKATKEYAESLKISDKNFQEEKWNYIFRTLIPLLSDSAYIEPNDTKEKLTIMFQSSLLLSAVALKLGRKKESITFYMNAYLLSEPATRKFVIFSLKELVPESVSIPEFQNIYVPIYKVNKMIESKPGKFEIRAELDSDAPDRILEMAAGDILYKIKYSPEIIPEPKNFQSLLIRMNLSGTQIAIANWNSVDDLILVRRLALKK